MSFEIKLADLIKNQKRQNIATQSKLFRKQSVLTKLKLAKAKLIRDNTAKNTYNPAKITVNSIIPIKWPFLN